MATDFHKNIGKFMFDYSTLKKIFFKFQPETAHNIAEFGLKSTNLFPGILSFVANKFVINDKALHQNLMGANFYNPVGLAGGFDKNATMLRPLASLGFGYMEFGTITPKAQSGNEKPRLFRLVEDESIQNAMGFNNDGCEAVKKNVEKIYPFAVPLIANIGKNKITPNENAIDDYEFLTREFSDFCDMFLINVSSPNTPNLRDLQDESFINEIFSSLQKITTKPIIFKIAADLEHDKAISLCKTAANAGAAAIVINNTSIDYSLLPNIKEQKGGISGKLITQKSRELFKAVADELYGETVLISCGGIDSAKEAYDRIKMGANLVQIYTSFIFKGPSIVKDINEGLLKLLKDDGFTHISQAVGVNVKKG